MKNPNRRSTSFTHDEIELACKVLMGLLDGRDVSVLINRQEYRALTSRFLRMREAVRNKVTVRDLGEGEQRRTVTNGGLRAAI
jgi:hypothetical protein